MLRMRINNLQHMRYLINNFSERCFHDAALSITLELTDIHACTIYSMDRFTSHHKTTTNIFDIKVLYDTPNIFVLFDRLFCLSLFSFFHIKHLFYSSCLQHNGFNTCWNNWHKYDFVYLNILNVTKFASSNNLM